MKINEDPRKITVSQTNMAKALGLTSARIHQLIQEGIIVRNDDDPRGGVWLVQSIRNYDTAKGGTPAAPDDDFPDIDTEKARHERVKRELAELKLAKAEARVYDSKTVELVLTEMLSNLRTQLLGLPSKLAPIIEGKSKEDIYQLMTEEVESKLLELSEYTPDLFIREEVGDSDEDSD